MLGFEHASFHPGEESFNLIFGDELADGVEDCVFGEVGWSEGNSFWSKVQDGSVEKFQGKQLIDEIIIGHQGIFEFLFNVKFLEQAELWWNVAVNHRQYRHYLVLVGGVLQWFVINFEHSKQKLSGEREVEMRWLFYHLSN